MLPAILICAFMVKNAATQTVTASLGTTKSCLVEGSDDVKLLCTVSSGCCSAARLWQKVDGAVTLLNDGASSNPSKYVEDYDGGTTGFNLIIKNVQKSDLGLSYKCQYSVFLSNELYVNNTLCPSSEVNISALFNETTGNCWECAGQDYGWSILGTALIVTVIFMIIAKAKIGEPKTVLIVVGLTFLISAGVNIPFALAIGYKLCHCVDGKAPWFIALGLVTSGITGVITLIYMLKQGSSQGSNGSNEQPLKENKKKKPAAEKSSNEPPLEKKKKKKSAAETGSRSSTSAAKHIKTANNETEMIPTEKGFSGDLEKKRPLPPLTNQPSPTNRPLPLPSSTKPLPSSTRPLPQITTNKGDN